MGWGVYEIVLKMIKMVLYFLGVIKSKIVSNHLSINRVILILINLF